MRKNHLDVETVLAAATERFITRFHSVERELNYQGKKLGEANLAEMDQIWERLKLTTPSSR